jgi:hypothetical protein
MGEDFQGAKVLANSTSSENQQICNWIYKAAISDLQTFNFHSKSRSDKNANLSAMTSLKNGH